MTFDSGLEEAQRLGYAEADPAKDISGEDAREKLAILAMLLYNTEVKPDDILCDGLQDIRSDEIRRVRDLRYILKPLVMAKYYNGCAELRVHPTLIGQDHRLASIDGVENAIFWEGELCGPQMYRGKGAGRDATTSAVISDMLHVADNIKRGVVDELPTLNSGIRIRDKADVKMSGYLMVTLKDVPGARDAVTDIASKHEVNMIQLLQREQDRFEAADGKRFAQMELTMFQTEYHKLEAVLRELGGLNEFVLGKPMLLKLEE
jgi:homoserine dehydrogenase